MSDWIHERDERQRGGPYGGPGGLRRDYETRSFGRDRGWAEAPPEGYRYGRRDNRRFNNRDEDYRLPRDETDRLIASDKIEGTRIYSHDGDRLGRVENFMVDKRSGRVEYVVMSFGGAMGVGDRHYPLPWHMLTYDEEMDGYVVDLTPRDLERAPSHRASAPPRYDRDYDADIWGYYGR